MFLKKMVLLGFKSFADKTEIHFQDGVTALLGPNGCGKSNVVDAIKWVLGEQSTRNMRAENMVDVIFNGTEQRKALNVAEVTLTIANDENLLELDVPEIEVKRRLYRSGESEYMINNTPVKLKEVRELFLDTGVGKSAYSIMEQGKIDQILSNKPEDRRYIFEEAAGITRFKIRGAEAERKLKKTEENMTQVENILHEVRKNHDSLKKQSEKTAVFRKKKDALYKLEVTLRQLQWMKLQENQERHENRKVKVLEKLERIQKDVQSLSLNLKERHDQVDHMENTRIDIQKKLYGLDIEEENKRHQIKTNQERKKEFESEQEGFRQREHQLNERLREIQAEKEERKNEIQGFMDRVNEIDNTILALEKTIENSENAVQKDKDQIQKKEEELHQKESEREVLQEELRVLTDHIVSELDKGLKNSGFSLQRKETLLKNIQGELDRWKILIGGKKDLIKDHISVKKGDLQPSDSILQGFQVFLEEMDGSLVKHQDQIEQLGSIFPSFLEDFLSPSGIIVQRRENENSMERLHGQMKQLREDSENLNKHIVSLQEKMEESRKLLENYRVNRVRLITQKAAVEDSLQSLQKEWDKEELQLKDVLEWIAQVQKRITQSQDAIDNLEKEILKINVNKDNFKKDLKNLEKGIHDNSEELQGQEKELLDKRELIQTLSLDREKEEIEIQHCKEEILQLLNDFRDRHSRDLDPLDKDKLSELSIQDIRTQMSDMKQDVKSLGQVNLMAPEEFAEVKERYDFLNGQMEDLRKAREHLNDVTREIRKESEVRFQETYKQIEENFHQMFRKLFGGGRGEFKLTEPDNPLESGIEIYAQPPGKKLENISLLSGGERSLTGVGLLFATYLVKPSPFCILDEIDAALDDANIQRFVHVLMDFADRSQYVVITHNKKTVTGAKTLLGVTMQESGVSRLVSMRIDKEES